MGILVAASHMLSVIHGPLLRFLHCRGSLHGDLNQGMSNQKSNMEYNIIQNKIL
jgi:hypothetical protein